MSRKRTMLNLLITAGAGILASLFTLHMGEVYAALRLPILFPPVWLIPVGWSAVLILLAFAQNRIMDGTQSGSAAQRTAFYVSLALVLLWAVVFFRFDAKFAGLVIGLLLTGVWLHTMRLTSSRRVSKLLLPCVIWAGYMAYLNLGIVILN